MNPQTPAFKFIRRADPASFVANQTVSITIGGGTDTDVVENVPTLPDTALEVQLDDGSTYVLLAYQRK